MAERPTFDELVVALKALDKPENGLQKHLSTIIVGAVMAIGVWTVSSVNASQIALSEIKVTVEASAKSVEKLLTNQNDQNVEIASLKQRVDALEQKKH